MCIYSNVHDQENKLINEYEQNTILYSVKLTTAINQTKFRTYQVKKARCLVIILLYSSKTCIIKCG